MQKSDKIRPTHLELGIILAFHVLTFPLLVQGNFPAPVPMIWWINTLCYGLITKLWFLMYLDYAPEHFRYRKTKLTQKP